ncbi:hypothetical protein L1987_74463 [Smallanthus sonchifolius]|uniref:Uncharacterized protein n=1 Tax=Smallanthus sonchifolius TaxID=185202 RepID=A0ACB9A342_9ASTR|nr:hypothetical protein L1987_74463 [Smallanthus sonchifolius]
MVCESWVQGKNVVIAFDIISEKVTELSVPPVQWASVFMTDLVNVRDGLHMIVTIVLHEMTLKPWVLKGEEYVNAYSPPPIPPIPLSMWYSVTYYITNGKWFVMSDSTKHFEITTDMERLECTHVVIWFRDQDPQFKGHLMQASWDLVSISKTSTSAHNSDIERGPVA